MAEHEEDDKLHLHLAINTTLQLKSDNKKLQSEIAELRRDFHSFAHVLQLKDEPLTYKLNGYQEKMERGQSTQFQPRYSHPQGYLFALKVDIEGKGFGRGTHIGVSVVAGKGDYDAKLKWPLLGYVTITLLNQMEDKNHHSVTLTLSGEDNIRQGSNCSDNTFIRHSKLGYDPVKNTQYLKNDTLYFRMAAHLA